MAFIETIDIEAPYRMVRKRLQRHHSGIDICTVVR